MWHYARIILLAAHQALLAHVSTILLLSSAAAENTSRVRQAMDVLVASQMTTNNNPPHKTPHTVPSIKPDQHFIPSPFASPTHLPRPTYTVLLLTPHCLESTSRRTNRFLFPCSENTNRVRFHDRQATHQYPEAISALRSRPAAVQMVATQTLIFQGFVGRICWFWDRMGWDIVSLIMMHETF